MKTVREGWVSYRDQVMPADAGDVQKQETERAFHAGAWHALMIAVRIGEPDISNDEGVRIFEAMRVELMDYYYRLRRENPA